MNTIKYDKNWFDNDVNSLIKQLRSTQFDIIVGINRGGCLPAVVLSHALKTPVTMIDFSTRDGVNVHPRSLYQYFEQLSALYKHVLIVDDLVDSGKAMLELVKHARMFHDVTVATLLHNGDVELPVKHYYGTMYSRKEDSRYFDFWWEEYGISNV
jgi:hypoxanthine phosphoribosyltransferase